MSRATYETQNKRWCLRFFSLDDKGNRIEKKKRIVDREFYLLPTRAQKAKQKQMTEEAARLEVLGMGGETPQRAPHKTTAVDYLSKLICRAENALSAHGNLAGILTTAAREKGVREALLHVKSFRAWLDEHASKVELAAVTPAHAVEFAQALRAQELSRNTVRHYIIRLSWVFKQLVVKDQIKRNPFDDTKQILSLVERAEETFKRKKVTPAQFYDLLHNIVYRKTGIKKDKVAFQCFAMVYFGIVTGWRQGDIVNKTWQDIDYERGTIYNLHRKTKGENACETILPLTELGRSILAILDGMNGGGLHCRRKYARNHDDIVEKIDGEKYKYLFNFNLKRIAAPRDGETDKEREERQALNEERNARAFHHASNQIFACFNLRANDKVKGGKNSMARTTYHSLRKTVISFLFGENIQESVILKMVGHADNTIERKHYQEFDLEHYADAVELLENAFVKPFFLHGIGKDDEQKVYGEFTHLFAVMKNAAPARFARVGSKLEHYGIERLLGDKYGINMDDLLYYYRAKERQERRKQSTTE